MNPSPWSAQGEALQKQVQRHLGRCLMRIQQFELVMEDFDIFSDAGCTQALQHLLSSYSKIDRQTLQLQKQLKVFHHTRKLYASLMQSPEFWQTMDDDAEYTS